jgi:hypothetical protein
MRFRQENQRGGTFSCRYFSIRLERRALHMEYTYDQLKGMTVAQMRKIAAGIEHDAVKGYTQLNKEHLLAALCTALNIDTHTRHKSKVFGVDKAKIKAHLKELKAKRDAALGAHDHARLKAVRREMHAAKRSLRKAASQAAANAPAKTSK